MCDTCDLHNIVGVPDLPNPPPTPDYKPLDPVLVLTQGQEQPRTVRDPLHDLRLESGDGEAAGTAVLTSVSPDPIPSGVNFFLTGTGLASVTQVTVIVAGEGTYAALPPYLIQQPTEIEVMFPGGWHSGDAVTLAAVNAAGTSNTLTTSIA